MSLNHKQVQMIEADVKNAGLMISVLHQELVDHICCEVEALIDDGKDFQEAYAIVIKHANIKMLQSIENNTMMLIDKKYAQMKIFTKISGNISLVLIALGTIMKIYALSGANIFLVIGFAILCMAFIPMLIYTSLPDNMKNKRLLFKISALIGCAAFAGGILFRVMNWPGSNILIIVAYLIILIISMPALLYDISKNTFDVTGRRINTFGVLSLMVFILSTMFKMFHLPGAMILMIMGAVMLVSITLPAITYLEYKKSGVITGRYIFIIILTFYVITMSLLMSYQLSPVIQDVISTR